MAEVTYLKNHVFYTHTHTHLKIPYYNGNLISHMDGSYFPHGFNFTLLKADVLLQRTLFFHMLIFDFKFSFLKIFDGILYF